MGVLSEDDLVDAVLIGILVEKLSQTNLSWRVQRLGIFIGCNEMPGTIA